MSSSLLAPFSKFVIVAILGCTPASMACGFWNLKDLETQMDFSFLASSVYLIDAKRPDPKIMVTGNKRSFFPNGSRASFENGKVVLSEMQGKSKSGRRLFKSREIGTVKNNTLTLGEVSYEILKTQETKVKGQKTPSVEIEVRLGDKTVAKGRISDSCYGGVFPAETSLSTQIQRVMSFFVWKSLKLDPYSKPVENWWW